MFVVLRMIYRALRRKPSSGEEGLVGSRAAVLEKTESGRDIVMIHGEYWRISCGDEYGTLSAGDEVEVIGVESTTLIVKPIARNR
jgi:membrane protein implicated in regulation of membrane protease activity